MSFLTGGKKVGRDPMTVREALPLFIVIYGTVAVLLVLAFLKVIP